jgi:hypothetical protein
MTPLRRVSYIKINSWATIIFSRQNLLQDVEIILLGTAFSDVIFGSVHQTSSAWYVSEDGVCAGDALIRTCKQRSWLKHYATSQKVSGSISDEVIVRFNWPKPSSRIVVPGIGSASNKNEYQESSWGLRAAGA